MQLKYMHLVCALDYGLSLFVVCNLTVDSPKPDFVYLCASVGLVELVTRRYETEP